MIIPFIDAKIILTSVRFQVTVSYHFIVFEWPVPIIHDSVAEQV